MPTGINKHPNWKGGTSFGKYSPDFGIRFRRLIRKRDNQICMLCGIHTEKLYRALDVHHIDYRKTNHNPANLITLCHLCHAKTQFRREAWLCYFGR